MIGKELSPILAEVEETLWEFESNKGVKPEFTHEGFRAAIKIFMCAVMDKMWELEEKENISMQDRLNMAEKCGNEVRSIIKTYTGIDAHSLYNQQQ